MALEIQLILALLLDFLIGDPRWFPHPVKLVGCLARDCEKIWRICLPIHHLAGLLSVLTVLSVTGGTVYWALTLAALIHPILSDCACVWLLYSALATRDLVDHIRVVQRALEQGNLEKARSRVGYIVGRDTYELDEAGVVRACIESGSESIDGRDYGPHFFMRSSAAQSASGYTKP